MCARNTTRGLAIACAAMMCLGGCSTYRGSRTTAIVGGGMVLVGGAMAWAWTVHDNNSEGGGTAAPRPFDLVGVGGLFIGAAGALIGISGIVGMGAYAGHADTEAQPDVLRRQDRDTAWTLTKTAAAAARHDDCTTVVELAVQVSALDAELYVSVFMRDAAIARCFEATMDER